MKCFREYFPPSPTNKRVGRAFASKATSHSALPVITKAAIRHASSLVGRFVDVFALHLSMASECDNVSGSTKK